MTENNSADSTKIDGKETGGWFSASFAPVRKAVLKGLGVIMPPLLTIVLFVWAWSTLDNYVLGPIEATARYLIVFSISDIRDEAQVEQELLSFSTDDPQNNRLKSVDGVTIFESNDGPFVKVNKSYIPREVYEMVEQDPGDTRATTAKAYYHRYVGLRYLQRQYVIPLFLALFVIVLYLVGKLLAAGVGRLLWNQIEQLINRIPIIRNVYSSVKQITDFAFNEKEVQFTRIVAVEYPRKGIWSMGFVTGEGMMDIRTAANEPCLSVLMPTSPMPATGFTITVPKSETIDLNISVDQAIQFCVSCGVVVPQHQQSQNTIEAAKVAKLLEAEVAAKAAGESAISTERAD